MSVQAASKQNALEKSEETGSLQSMSGLLPDKTKGGSGVRHMRELERLSHWQQRVFRNTFTRKGRLFRVKRWSVKIQFQGQRRTLSLRARTRLAAAREARTLHQT